MFMVGMTLYLIVISDCRCNALREDRTSREWEHIIRICFLCVLLQKFRHFEQLSVTSPGSNINWRKLVKATLLVNCLLIGYCAAARRDERMISLVSVLDSIIKAYKIVDEVLKLIFG